ncbi:hypothetical protein OIDMADRAFT_21532 [Oidiodendron maius Zn]|uniref:Uncharacterized protein n=1 Tax=Oidiodendron maius (strain Zn) TaxID=913774 RepID=A0A0C3CU75_OIDMZ|nr:hypothetical protein OIDMADRAFT_21532 [Oidiodendron maius Zn]
MLLKVSSLLTPSEWMTNVRRTVPWITVSTYVHLRLRGNRASSAKLVNIATRMLESINLQSADCSVTAQTEFLNIETPNFQSGFTPLPELIGHYVRECSDAS